MTDYLDDIETQLRAWADDLVETIDTDDANHLRDDALRSPSGGRSSRIWWAAAAVIVVLCGAGVSLALWSGEGETVDTAGASTVAATYERVEYKQTSELHCPGTDGVATESGSAVIEGWSDTSGVRQRNLITYPDGTTRALVIIGESGQPPAAYSAGSTAIPPARCAAEQIGTLIAEPAQGDFFSVNPAGGASQGSGALLHPGYRELGTRVESGSTDSLGRAADLYRQVTEGLLSPPPGSGSEPIPITQTTSWYVDPADGSVLEQTYRYEIESVGSAEWQAVRTDAGQVEVPAAFFETQGMQQLN